MLPNILFEDTHLMVIDKPAGLLSQGEITGEPNLIDWARAHVGRHYVGLVHRLDRNTTGAMVLAKRTKAAQRLTDGLQRGSLNRTYLAWLIDPLGVLAAPARWQHLLVKDERTNITKALSAGTGPDARKIDKNAKSATLLVEPRARGKWQGVALTLAEFRLETGRSHQIRAQAQASGFPLLGDVKYGDHNATFGRPALHSSVIEFIHPMTQAPMRFEAPLPEDMRSVQPLR